MHLSNGFLNSLLFYTDFRSPYILYVTGVFKADMKSYIPLETAAIFSSEPFSKTGY